MKWHRRRISALNETIHTERFTLIPVRKPRAVKLFRKMNQDRELLFLLTHCDDKSSLWQIIRKYSLPNGRSRFMHEILETESGNSIGYHETRLAHYHTANLGVVIFDRDWWGKAVPIEVRKAVLRHFARHAAVERFCGNVESRNFASILNYKRLGFRHIGTLHRCEFDDRNKVPLDYLQFELLKEDFPPYFHGDRA